MFLPEEFRIFLRPGATDMRKSINTLSALVLAHMTEVSDQLYSGALFLFCNRKRDTLKILYWDRTGFALWQKRLEKARFPWLSGGPQARELSIEELQWLLQGIGLFDRHDTLNY